MSVLAAHRAMFSRQLTLPFAPFARPAAEALRLSVPAAQPQQLHAALSLLAGAELARAGLMGPQADESGIASKVAAPAIAKPGGT